MEGRKNFETAVGRAREVLSLLTPESEPVAKGIWGSPMGKSLLAKRIVAEIPEHRVYVEPFAGGAQVLFHKEPSEVEVVNDLDPDIAFAFKFAKNLTPAQLEQLKKRKWVGDKAHFDKLLKSKPTDGLDRFYRFAYLSRFSFNVLRRGAMSDKHQGVQARFMDKLEKHAPRLKHIKVRNADYEKVIEEYDGPSTFFFLDPPYAGYDADPRSGAGHKNWDEQRFAKVLKKIRGRFLCTYGIRGDASVFDGFNVRRWKHTSGVGSTNGKGPQTAVTLIATNYDPATTKRFEVSVSKTIWGSPAGKKRLADKLAAMLPPHKTYVEPFAGSAAVLFAKEPSQVEVINDADVEIAKAYRTIKRLSAQQIDALKKMPWKGDEAAFKRLIDKKPSGDVESLYRFLYLTHFSYGKLRGKSFSPSSAGVVSRSAERIESFAPRLKNVRIYDGDYGAVVKKYDGPNTVFFLDPPYVGHDVDVGEGDFDEERFFEILKNLKGKFLLTYGIRGKLPGLLKNSSFHVKRIRTPRSIRSMHGVGGPSMLTQLVVTNYTQKSDPELEDWEDEDLEKAEWSRAYINDLPDSAFLYIEPSGEKDEDGKTVPRSLRHFPVRDADGKLDLAHLQSAIARIPQAKLPGLDEDDLQKLQDKARKLLEEADKAPASKRVSPFNKPMPLVKGADPKDERFVLGVVLEPDVVDAQGDTYSAEEVRRAAHKFMEQFGGLGLMHRLRVNDEVKVLENYLAPGDLQLGQTKVTNGTWLLAVRILSDELWGQVKDGALTGFSIGGSARREPDGAPVPSAKSASPLEDEDEQTAPRRRNSSVNRLHDIVVEEVSLVDRAANKKRFLIVKRSEQMSEQFEQTTQDLDGTDFGADPPAEQATTESTQDSDANLQAAVSALESLTDAVELLGVVGEEEGRARVTEVAGELRQVADQLGGVRAESQPAVEAHQDSQEQPKPNLDELLGSVKAALRRAKAVLPSSVQSTEKSELAELIGELRSLTSTVKEQQQRLGKLEKRFGLPSSVPAGEQRSRRDDEVGWPMDMNRNLDRESVDDDVSFFDL